MLKSHRYECKHAHCVDSTSLSITRQRTAERCMTDPDLHTWSEYKGTKCRTQHELLLPVVTSTWPGFLPHSFYTLLSPDVILCGWLGSKHQPTNYTLLTSVMWHFRFLAAFLCLFALISGLREPRCRPFWRLSERRDVWHHHFFFFYNSPWYTTLSSDCSKAWFS